MLNLVPCASSFQVGSAIGKAKAPLKPMTKRHEGYFKCPNCGNMDFHLDAESMARGDKATAIECSACGWTGFA